MGSCPFALPNKRPEKSNEPSVLFKGFLTDLPPCFHASHLRRCQVAGLRIEVSVSPCSPVLGAPPHAALSLSSAGAPCWPASTSQLLSYWVVSQGSGAPKRSGSSSSPGGRQPFRCLTMGATLQHLPTKCQPARSCGLYRLRGPQESERHEGVSPKQSPEQGPDSALRK